MVTVTTPDVNIYLVNFSTSGKEMVVQNEDGSYTVLINAKLSQDGQLKAYQHALNHIENGDFEKSDVQSIEFQAHELKSVEDFVPIPASKFEKRIKQLQKERKKLQQALKDKEKEIDLIINLYGSDYFFKNAEQQWLYGWIE